VVLVVKEREGDLLLDRFFLVTSLKWKAKLRYEVLAHYNERGKAEVTWASSRTCSRRSGDLTIRWTRRSRALVADSWTGSKVPPAEEAEVYDAKILDGAVVKRRLTSGTTSVTYTAAQQTADCDAALESGDSLDILIFQLSALVGRGAGQISTMTF